MAYKVMRAGNTVNNPMFRSYICDTREDIPNIIINEKEISWGAELMVIEDSSVWLLNSSGEWKELE